MSAYEKECPFCCAAINARAVVCRYCGRDLPEVTASPSLPVANVSPVPTPGAARKRRKRTSTIATDEIAELLSSLVSRCLAVFDEATGRYHLLETVRQFARDRLMETGAAESWRDRHLKYFAALGEDAEPHLTDAQQQTWLERLDAEHDNLRTALEWSAGRCPDSGLCLAGAIWRFWYVRGHFGEGRGRIAELLAATDPNRRTSERARAMNGAGVLASLQGSYAAARQLYEESLEIRRELGDLWGVSNSFNNLGHAAYEQADYATSHALYAESLQIRRRLNDSWGIAVSLNNLGLVAFEQGDYAAARALHEESLQIRKELGDRRGIAMSLTNLGLVASESGDHAGARALHEESLMIRNELGDRGGIAVTMNNLGLAAFQQGEHVSARELHEKSLQIRRELGDLWGIAQSLNQCGTVAVDLADYTAARALHEESLKIRSGLGDRRGIAYCLEGLAAAAATIGKLERTAARLWGAAERLRENIGSPLSPNERSRREEAVAAARVGLGNDAVFDAAWEEGRAMSLEQAIELALQGVDE